MGFPPVHLSAETVARGQGGVEMTCPCPLRPETPGGGGGGGGGTLVLGTHCKTDSGSCGCRPEKKKGGGGVGCHRPKNSQQGGCRGPKNSQEGGCQRGISCRGCSC